MLRKRLMGAVVVRQGWAVQSFGYRRWLPLGKPECVVENLDRWGADGIVVIAMDRGKDGPDLDLIRRIGAMGLSTPITYGGGLSTEKHAKAAVHAGAERLVIDSVLSEQPAAVSEMANSVGIQALVAALPMIITAEGTVRHLRYVSRTTHSLSKPILDIIHQEKVSEVLVIDANGEGKRNGFNLKLLEEVQTYTELPLLGFGGLATSEQIRILLNQKRVSGVIVGNELNYKEHSIGLLKNQLIDQQLRRHRQFLSR